MAATRIIAGSRGHGQLLTSTMACEGAEDIAMPAGRVAGRRIRLRPARETAFLVGCCHGCADRSEKA
jgi:hypothetical protein